MKFKNLKVGDCFYLKPSHGDDVEFMKIVSYRVMNNDRIISGKLSFGITEFNAVIVYGEGIGHIKYFAGNIEVERV